ncbi:Steroid C26-monooxygenase [Streptomyces sp. YIM 121038]|uniref:cytochrome P450 n=1 Tax=Streptomyces sp. YIM 121038 TaxID=2136401 RepID=UPI00110FFA14|nr:cytochrome P450 [Streptomyces sp. YIM 121038]QCX81937.1 Steroid C26-monooxygenase [Streptomyces sp. YIM 121038]
MPLAPPECPFSGPAPSLTDPDLYARGDPHGLWRELRDTRPVSWQDEGERGGFWSVTGYEDAQRVLREWKDFTSTRGTMLRENLTEPYPGAGTMLALTDPPRHDVIRKALTPLFTPRAMARLETRARQVTAALIDEALTAGHCDVATDIAARIPLAVTAELLGVRDDAVGPLEAAMACVTGADVDSGEVQEAHLEILRYYTEALFEPPGAPDANVVSALLHARSRGQDISDEEIILACDNVIVAATETSRNAMTSGLLALLRHPTAWAELRAGRLETAPVVEEILRLTAPATHVLRVATRDLTLSGARIKAGDAVVVWLTSVNRDASAFEEPDTVRFDRRPNRHLTFGTGVHFCLGAPLARLLLSVFLGELAHRTGKVELAGEPRRNASHHVWGYASLPVSLSPRADHG